VAGSGAAVRGEREVATVMATVMVGEEVATVVAVVVTVEVAVATTAVGRVAVEVTTVATPVAAFSRGVSGGQISLLLRAYQGLLLSRVCC
jgi:hypothetical protein